MDATEESKLIEVINLFTKEFSFNVTSIKDLEDESKVVKIIHIL